MRWAEVEERQPKLAEVGRKKLAEPGVVLVGTIRRDGSPRISPAEPLFWEGDIWFPMLWESLKAADLMRDPRLLVHSIVTGPDGGAGEFKLRGRAIVEKGPIEAAVAKAVATVLGWTPVPGRFHLFRVDVDDVTYIRWEGDNNQYVTRWPSGGEFVRHGTSPTSLGPREPLSDLLV